MFEYADHENIAYNDEEPRVYQPTGEEVHVIDTPDIVQMDIEEDVQLYSQRFIDLVSDQTYVGIPETVNAMAMAGVSKHGERAIRLFCFIDPVTHSIKSIGFQTQGDLATIACASLIVSKVHGLSIKDALCITADSIKKELGKMPSDRVTRPYLAVCALRAAIGDFMLNQGATLEELDGCMSCEPYSIECIMCQHCSLRDRRYELQHKLQEK